MSPLPSLFSLVLGSFLLLTNSIHGGATFTFSAKNSRRRHYQFGSPQTTTVSLLSNLQGSQSLNMNILNRIRGGSASSVNIDDNLPPAGGATDEFVEKPVTRNIQKLQGMFFSGQLLPNLRQLFAGSADSYARGWQAVNQFHHTGNVVILFSVSMLTIPLMQIFHQIYYQMATKLVKKEYKEYEKSKFSAVGTFITQGGRIASLIYLVELVTTFLLNVLIAGTPRTVKPVTAPPPIPKSLVPLQKFPNLFANCLYGYWFAKQIVKVKAHILRRFYSKLPDPETYDNLFDFLIYIMVSILVLDASEFDLEALVKSLIAVGGLSSIVVGLALKDPATQLLQGALMMATNKFRRNEQIRLGDGTQGKVVDIGLLETTIVGGDDIQVKIPHSKITGQKFSNISRMVRSQTKFELRFNLHDMHRINDIAAAIKEEIMNTCPTVITDGSRPFRVLWTDIREDHIILMVDAHHSVPPACNAYWETRQNVLKAISTATKRSKAKFAMPVQVSAPLPKGGIE